MKDKSLNYELAETHSFTVEMIIHFVALRTWTVYWIVSPRNSAPNCNLVLKVASVYFHGILE
jgi:hypothetical protein